MALTVGLWIYLVIVAIVLLFSVVSNALVIYCVIKFPRLRSVTHVLICNLALSDILLAGFVMPQKLHDLSHEEDFFEGKILCKIVNFCPIFVITSSIFSLVCVSFERRRAIIQSQRPQMTYSTLYKIVPVIWIFSLLVSVPTLVEYTVNTITLESSVNSTKTLLSCGSHHMSQSYKLTNAIFVVMISYIVPTIMMIKNYVEVALFLFRKVRQTKAQNEGPGQNTETIHRIANRIKVVKLLVVVAVIFAVSWMPFFVLLLYTKITNNDASNDATSFSNLFLVALASFSTAYNVILYVIYNPSFSRAFKEVLRCKNSTVAPVDQASSRKIQLDIQLSQAQGSKSVHGSNQTKELPSKFREKGVLTTPDI